MLENLDFNPLITAAAGALTGAAGIWVTMQRHRIKEAERKAETSNALLVMSEIYDSLNELCSETKADRALVLYTSNGGGIPKPTGIVNATILYEVVAKAGLKPIRADFQHIPLDQSYTKMLREVILNGEILGKPEDLIPGFIKTQYIDEKVDTYYIWEILKTNDKYFYGSLRWDKPLSKITLDQLRSYTSIHGSKIANLLNKN